jgi:CheY-like chemotaxis protein
MLKEDKGVSALIVDDNKGMREIVISMLKAFGIIRSAYEASDANQALALMRQRSIDLVITDYVLPPAGVGGIELIRQIRALNTRNRFSAVIMLTAHSSRKHVTEAINAGANEFMTKPVSAQALANRVNAIAQSKRPFIQTASYFGPDRRRRHDPQYSGPFRREGDTHWAAKAS